MRRGSRWGLVAALSVAAVVVPASQASASPCPSPYNYPYVITGVTLTQPTSSSNVGTSLMLSGTVSGRATQGGGLAGVCVDLTVTGANALPAQAVHPADDGTFTFTYKGNQAGTDSVNATTGPDNGSSTRSATVRHTWVVPPSPTPRPTPKATPSPTPRQTTAPPVATRTPSPTPSPSSSPPAGTTPSPTPPPTSTSPTPVAPSTPTLGDGSVTLDRPSGLPGGSVQVTGKDCPAGSAVAFDLDGTPAGTATAGVDGSFTGPVALPDAPIGAHQVTVTCGGVKVSLPLDLVVASATAVAPALGVTVAAVLVFFVLLGSILLNRTHTRRQRIAS